jgi:hypothetical protein
MPDKGVDDSFAADTAALKVTLQKVAEDLRWLAEQLTELRKEIESDVGQIPLVPVPFPEPPTTQTAVITHARTYRPTRLNAKP